MLLTGMRSARGSHSARRRRGRIFDAVGLFLASFVPIQFLIQEQFVLLVLSLALLFYAFMIFCGHDLRRMGPMDSTVRVTHDCDLAQGSVAEQTEVGGSARIEVLGAAAAYDMTASHTPTLESGFNGSDSEVPSQRKDFQRLGVRELTSRHPGYALDQSEGGKLFVLAGSAIGAGHDQAADPREDAVAFLANTQKNRIVCAIADGVGSTILAHEASCRAAQAAVDALSELNRNMDDLDVSSWTSHADSILRDVNSALGPECSAFGTNLAPLLRLPLGYGGGRRNVPRTTLVAAVVELAEATMRCCWLSVGDSELAVLEAGSSCLKWLTDRQSHGGPIDATLPGSVRPSCSGVLEVPLDATILLLTDGMAEVLERWSLGPISKAIDRAKQRKGALSELAAAIDARVIGVNDDRSVIAVGVIGKGASDGFSSRS